MLSTAWDSTLSHWAAAFTPHTQWSFWEGRSFWKKLACSQWQRRPAGQLHKQINACLTLGPTSTPLFCAPGSPFPWHFLTPHLPSLEGYELHQSWLKRPSRCIKYDRKKLREPTDAEWSLQSREWAGGGQSLGTLWAGAALQTEALTISSCNRWAQSFPRQGSGGHRHYQEQTDTLHIVHVAPALLLTLGPWLWRAGVGGKRPIHSDDRTAGKT